MADVTPENAKFFDESNPSGAVITQVETDSPAAKAGLQIGDVIPEALYEAVAEILRDVWEGQPQPPSPPEP